MLEKTKIHYVVCSSEEEKLRLEEYLHKFRKIRGNSGRPDNEPKGKIMADVFKDKIKLQVNTFD